MIKGKRRRKRGADAEGFGTSMGDVLMTALGCVLLLFLVAVMTIRTSLEKEQKEREQALASLEAMSDSQSEAQSKLMLTEATKKRAHEALSKEERARLAAQRELAHERKTRQSAESRLKTLQQKIEQMKKEKEALTGGLEKLEARYAKLKNAASRVVAANDKLTPQPVDIALVIDGTSSMKESIDAARRELSALLYSLSVVSPSPRIGAVVFRDRREDSSFRLQQADLTADVDELASFLGVIQASSTGVNDDAPEWMTGGIRAAAAMGFRDDAVKIMVVVSDAAPQDGVWSAKREVKAFREKGGRVFVMTTNPANMLRSTRVRTEFEQDVLPSHAQIAEAGGGKHIRPNNAHGIMRHVLDAVLYTRTSAPIDDLKDTLKDALEDADKPPTGT